MRTLRTLRTAAKSARRTALATALGNRMAALTVSSITTSRTQIATTFISIGVSRLYARVHRRYA